MFFNILKTIAVSLYLLRYAFCHPSESGLPELYDPYTGFSAPPPTNDILNTTFCYCMDEATLNDPKPRFGSYYHYEYFNFHLEKRFHIVKRCDTRETMRIRIPNHHHHEFFNACLAWWYVAQNNCQKDDQENQFCYEIRPRYKDIYWFNDEYRDLPPNPERWLPPQVADECERSCEMLGDASGLRPPMVMLKGDTAKAISEKMRTPECVWSHAEGYKHCDNMGICEDCQGP